MKHLLTGTAISLALCLTVSLAHSAQRAKGGEKPGGEKGASQKPSGEKSGGNKPPGGAWSEGKRPPSNDSRDQGAEKKKSPQATGAEGAAAEHAAGKNNPLQKSGAEGAAAGAAAANRNKPNATGKEGAAVGAAAANRNQPNATGKEGAAAGAAAANRNKPNATGAEGAAAGAAAANRNKPAASGAEGAAVGAAAANRNQPAVSGAVGAAAGYSAVRESFDHPHVYNEQWYADHQDAWTASNWPAGAAWTATNLAGVASHCGYSNSPPISYGYGDNVIFQNGNVMVDGRNVGSAEQFSQQAADLALIGHNATTSDADEWLPLGVFALVRYEDQHPQLTLQMAINKDGVLRGNYTDLVTDHIQPIQGAVDKESQRAAWTVGDSQSSFMEAGIQNLTSGDAPVLIHKYSRTERWMLVRITQPDQTGAAANSDSSK